MIALSMDHGPGSQKRVLVLGLSWKHVNRTIGVGMKATVTPRRVLHARPKQVEKYTP
jgi:hypothetical protein